MDKVKSEHLSSHNSTPNNKYCTRAKSPTEYQDEQQNQQQQQPQQKQRRSRSDNHNREFLCGCGKSYLSAAALYTHVKQKHGGVNQKGSQQPSNFSNSSKHKSKKNESAGEKCSVKQEDVLPIEQEIDASTVYDDIIHFFAKHIENNSNQKLESNEGYDWILEVFPRHFFSKGTDYFKILKNLENLINQINFFNNQVNNNNNQNYPSNSSDGKNAQINKSDTQLNGKNKNGDENFGEEYTQENGGESIEGSPNNLKKINKKLSGQCAVKNPTEAAAASFDDRHSNGQENNFQMNHSKLDKIQIEQQHAIQQQQREFDDQTIDIYDIQRDLRLTSLNKIFSIFILNISSRVSQQSLIEILVFITLFRKVLNEKGWETCVSPLPYDQRHHLRSQYDQQLAQMNAHDNNEQQVKKNKQSDNMTTTVESSGAFQTKKGAQDYENEEKQGINQEDNQFEDEKDIQEDEEENEHEDNENDYNGNGSDQTNKNKNKSKAMKKRVNEDAKCQQKQLNQQYEFCEYNCGQRVSEISNIFIMEWLPEYFKSVISNANELHIIGTSEEGIKNVCYIMQLFINWMYAFKFCESKLVFSHTDEEEEEEQNQHNEGGEEQQDDHLQKQKEEDIQEHLFLQKRSNKLSHKISKSRNQFGDAESSNNIENELNNNGDVSHDNLEGNNSGRFKNNSNNNNNNNNNNNLSGSQRKNNNNHNHHDQFNSLYDELEDESKENRHNGNQYNNDLEMIGNRKHRKIDMEDHNNVVMHNGDMNTFMMGNNFNMFDAQHLKAFPAQIYNGTPQYMRGASTANSTTYMNGTYSNRFYGGEPQSTSFYNSGNNSTTFYNPYNNNNNNSRTNYSHTYHNVDAFTRSNKFGDQETPKINALSMRSNAIPMMYGGGYLPMSQQYQGNTFINPAMYPLQPVYYSQQQAFLSPHNQLANQAAIGDFYNSMGNFNNNIGQNDFS